MKASAVLLAAGDSRRFGSNKLSLSLDGEPLLTRVLNTFSLVSGIEEIVLVVKAGEEEAAKVFTEDVRLPVRIIAGGETRMQSARIGVKAARCEYVLIHDAARAGVSALLIERVLAALDDEHGVIPAIPSPDTQISLDEKPRYLERAKVANVQTPQGFPREKLLSFLNATAGEYTDEGSLWAQNAPLRIVEGEVGNRKLTYLQDLYGLAGDVRTGCGYDVHKLQEGRKLILGGVIIPHEKGLVGVSDADVVLHAVMDALLSACALGDIGKFFPPSDPKYKDANSAGLLLTVLKRVKEAGYRPTSIAVTIQAERPVLAPYIPLIRSNIAALCALPVARVGVGATTTEGIGLIGREEGIGAQAACTVRSIG